jgi:hypothetical protein
VLARQERRAGQARKRCAAAPPLSTTSHSPSAESHSMRHIAPGNSPTTRSTAQRGDTANPLHKG